MLNGKQKRYLRTLANSLKPITQVGKDGVSDALINSVNESFNTHELIKINILKTCKDDNDDISNKICNKCNCQLVQVIGKTMVFYKKAKEPKIILP